MDCFSWIINTDDTVGEKQRKVILLMAAPPSIVIALLYIFLGELGVTAVVVGCLMVILALVASVSFILRKRRAPLLLYELTSLVVACGILLSDLRGAASAGNARSWTAVVLTMDVLLLGEGREWSQRSMLALTVVHLLICAVEDCFRFGLYDVSFADKNHFFYDCENPPCELGGHTIPRLGFYLLVFVLDYKMTRSFAVRMRKEQETMLAAVVASQRIAKSLAGFDLNVADEVLQSSDSLPKELQDAFAMLLDNLRVYRPYLPESCLPEFLQDDQAGCDDTAIKALDEDSSGTEQHSVATSALHSPNGYRASIAPFLDPSTVSVTVVAVNIKDFLKAGAISRVALHTSHVSHVLDKVHNFKGIVDSLSGDRLLLSFNGAKRCLQHHTNGALCAAHLFERSSHAIVSVGVASGPASCGDMGCATLRRFCIVGSVGSRVHMLERCHRAWGLPGVLCDGNVERNANCHLDFCLLPEPVLFAKTHQQMNMYMATLPDNNTVSAEWMYELDGRRNKWEAVNSFSHKFRTHTHGAEAELERPPVLTSIPLCNLLEAAVQRATENGRYLLLEVTEVGLSWIQTPPLLTEHSPPTSNLSL